MANGTLNYIRNPAMFEGLTDRVRRVLQLAQEEARTHGHDYVDTEHLLLGLLSEGGGLAMRTLEHLNISPDAMRTHLEQVIAAPTHTSHGSVTFTQQSAKVLESSLRNALTLGHNYLGSEHMLIGLTLVGDSLAARTLVTFGADQNRVKSRVYEEIIQLYETRRGGDPVELLREVKQETERLQVEIQEMENTDNEEE